MDIINDEEDEDISFVPSTILNHRMMRTPLFEIHKSKDKDGKEATYIKVIRKPYIYTQVE